jgi:hypothetical protein
VEHFLLIGERTHISLGIIMNLKHFAAALILSGSALGAQASLVADGGLPNGIDGLISDTTAPWSSQAATSFQVAANATINRVDWWGFYSYYGSIPVPAPDHDYSNIHTTTADVFGFNLYSASGNLPGNSLFSPTLSNLSVVKIENLGPTPIDPQTSANTPLFHYSATFQTLTIASGNYFASISNTPIDLSDPDGLAPYVWVWAGNTHGLGTAVYGDSLGAAQWDSRTDVSGLAFQLSNNVAAVPEPSTYAMMALGLMVMAMIRRRTVQANPLH